jgi:hypothetical protein
MAISRPSVRAEALAGVPSGTPADAQPKRRLLPKTKTVLSSKLAFLDDVVERVRDAAETKPGRYPLSYADLLSQLTNVRVGMPDGPERDFATDVIARVKLGMDSDMPYDALACCASTQTTTTPRGRIAHLTFNRRTPTNHRHDRPSVRYGAATNSAASSVSTTEPPHEARARVMAPFTSARRASAVRRTRLKKGEESCSSRESRFAQNSGFAQNLAEC